MSRENYKFSKKRRWARVTGTGVLGGPAEEEGEMMKYHCTRSCE